MNHENIERQINIKELIFSVVAKWRKIFVITLIAILATAIINIPSAISYISRLGAMLVIKILVRQMLAVGVFAFVGIIILYAFMYIISDKVKSIIDYELNSNLKLLGAVVLETNKYNNAVDRFIKKCRGINLYHKDRSQHIKRISNVIKAELSVKTCCEHNTIALVSVCSRECVEEFERIIANEKIENVTFKIASDILTSADSIKTVMESDYVLMVECQEKTTYAQLNSSICMIDSWKKEVIGLVLTDVDAM